VASEEGGHRDEGRLSIAALDGPAVRTFAQSHSRTRTQGAGLSGVNAFGGYALRSSRCERQCARSRPARALGVARDDSKPIERWSKSVEER
jgi:hypothetical protein